MTASVGWLRHNAVVLLRELVQTSEAVAATSGRTAKITEIAALLRRADPGEVPVVVAFLSGELRQRQIGVGYASLGELLRTGPAGGPPGGAGGPRAGSGPGAAHRGRDRCRVRGDRPGRRAGGAGGAQAPAGRPV